MKTIKENKFLISGVIGAIMMVFGLTVFILKATYAADVYSVVFDATGGTFVGSDYGQTKVSRSVLEGNTVQSQIPENPVRSDATFLYWTLDDVQFDFSTPITNSITLCAKWECEDCDVPEPTPEPTPPKEPEPENPKTGDLPIAIIMSIGICALGFSIFQYKLKKVAE